MKLLARIDRQLVDRPIWLPTVTLKTTDTLPPRLGNYRYNVMLSAMLDQLCVL